MQASARPEATAERDTTKEKLKTLPKAEPDRIRLATVFQVVFDTTSEQVDTDAGEVTPPKVATLEAMLGHPVRHRAAVPEAAGGNGG